MLIKNRKSQGLPVNVIIIAAIALVVFVVLAAMFTGKVRIFSQGLESCESKQGDCSKSACDPGYAVVNAKCGTGNPCCIKVLDNP